MSQRQASNERPITSLKAEVKSDLKVAQKLWMPWRVLLPFAVFCLAVIIICDRFGRLNMSLPLLNSVCVFGLLMYLKWQIRRQPLFWATLAIPAALHALLIWYIPWTSKWVPVLATISSVDFYVMLLVVNVAGRLGVRTRSDVAAG